MFKSFILTSEWVTSKPGSVHVMLKKCSWVGCFFFASWVAFFLLVGWLSKCIGFLGMYFHISFLRFENSSWGTPGLLNFLPFLQQIPPQKKNNYSFDAVKSLGADGLRKAKFPHISNVLATMLKRRWRRPSKASNKPSRTMKKQRRKRHRSRQKCVISVSFRRQPLPNPQMLYLIDGLRKTGDAPGHKPRLLLLVVLRILVVVVVVVVVGSSISCCCCCCCCWCCWFLDFLFLLLLLLLLMLLVLRFLVVVVVVVVSRYRARARAPKHPFKRHLFGARTRAVPWSVISTRKVSQNHRIYAIFSTC